MTGMKSMKRMLLLVVLTVSLLAGCERAADVASPEHFDDKGLRFSLPGNWEVTSNETNPHFRHLLVETPGDAIVIMHIYAKDEALSLDDFARVFSRQVTEAMPFGEVSGNAFTAREQAPGSLHAPGVLEHFDIEVMSVKVPHQRSYFTAQHAGRVLFVVTQALDEDLVKVQPGFDLVLSTVELY